MSSHDFDDEGALMRRRCCHDRIERFDNAMQSAVGADGVVSAALLHMMREGGHMETENEKGEERSTKVIKG